MFFPEQVPHRTTVNQTLDRHICRKPSSVGQLYKNILKYDQNRGSSLSPKTKYLKSYLESLVVNDCELLAFLELYHVIEPADVDQYKKEYYFTPSYFKFMDGSNYSVNQYTAGAPAAYSALHDEINVRHFIEHRDNKQLFVDFHEFLPVNMCLSLLCKLEEQIDDHVEILDMLTSYYEHQDMKFLVCLKPLQGIAEITVG